MDTASMISISVALISGFGLVLASVIGYLRKMAVPPILILSGVALIALPGAASMKLGPGGLELQNRNQLALINAQLADSARPAGRSLASTDSHPAKKSAALVFFRDSAAGKADKIVDRLRESGFLASGTPTDFSELGLERFKYSVGDSYIRYSAKHEEDAKRIQNMLKEEGVANVKLISTEKLSGGALQIGLF